MVASHTWHPGTGRIESRWPVPVPLEADELLSTWLVRVALSQGCDPLVLTGELWPKWRVWTLDLDRGVATERLRILERMSGIDMSALRYTSRQLSHKSILECVDFVLSSTGHAAWRWSSLDGGLSQTSSASCHARGGRFQRNGWRSRACA